MKYKKKKKKREKKKENFLGYLCKDKRSQLKFNNSEQLMNNPIGKVIITRRIKVSLLLNLVQEIPRSFIPPPSLYLEK